MIQINFSGRFGNQLFEYATCRSIAERNGYHFKIGNINHDTQFNRLLLPYQSNYINNNISNVLYSEKLTQDMYNNNDILSNEFYNIKDNTLLFGFFQREEFFDYNYKNVKKWFDVSNIIDMVSYNKLYDKYKDYCIIHLRGTDFLNIDYYINDIDNYYKKSINRIKELDIDIKFVVVTDDYNYAKKNFNNYDIISSDDYLIDFYLMNNSKYLILSNSTFSWWGAYLNDVSYKILYPFGGLSYHNDTHIFSKCKKFEYID